MKHTVTIAIVLCAIGLAQAGNISSSVKQNVGGTPGIQTKWISQYLDNFNKKDRKSWNMRYKVNEEYLKSGGPMFIYLYGERSIAPKSGDHDIIIDMAKEHNGILFYPEHRYYGKSKPTPDLSIENLQYLTVKQALADLAHFIRTQRRTDSRLTNSKVIICGCSYGGSMAIWFSELYPNLVDGIWATGAPTKALLDFKKNRHVVGQAYLTLGSQQCYNRIKNGINQLEAMFADQRAAEAKQMLQLCNEFNHENHLDLASLFSSISDDFEKIVQYQKRDDISRQCNNLMSYKDDVTAITETFVKRVSNGACIAVDYKGYVDMYKETSYKYKYLRPWQYQLCNEFGWFKSSSSKNQPFGSSFPIEYYINLCQDIFGAKYTKDYMNQLFDETNKVFGGRNPKLTKAYITNGDLDPYSPVAVLQGATYIPEASHCADLGSIKDSGSPALRQSKEHLLELVRLWLS